MIPDILGIFALFFHVAIVCQCIHEKIGMILVHDNQAQQPYSKVINNNYAYYFDPSPLKFTIISGKMIF